MQISLFFAGLFVYSQAAATCVFIFPILERFLERKKHIVRRLMLHLHPWKTPGNKTSCVEIDTVVYAPGKSRENAEAKKTAPKRVVRQFFLKTSAVWKTNRRSRRK